MSVLPEISLDHIERELEEASSFLSKTSIEIDTSMLNVDNLVFRASFTAPKDDELYIAEFECDNYREIPPYVEFINPETGERGTKNSYPNVFHGNPCICARFNRKTYSSNADIHSDWKYGDWQKEDAINHLGGMLSHIYNALRSRMNNREYNGRMN